MNSGNDMTLDEFLAEGKSRQMLPLADKFEAAYRKGMERDPVNFPDTQDFLGWCLEYDLFRDVGGDADDPIDVQTH